MNMERLFRKILLFAELLQQSDNKRSEYKRPFPPSEISPGKGVHKSYLSKLLRQATSLTSPAISHRKSLLSQPTIIRVLGKSTAYKREGWEKVARPDRPNHICYYVRTCSLRIYLLEKSGFQWMLESFL